MKKAVSARRIKVTLWLLFAVLLGGCIGTLNYFQNQSRQLLGSNFTALAVDIMQGQEDIHILKYSLDYLKQDSPFFDVQMLEKMALRLRYRLPLIERKIRNSTLEKNTYVEALTLIQQVKNNNLAKFRNNLEAYKQNPDNRAALIKTLNALEIKLAVAYSDLHNATQDASNIEKRLTNRLSLLIWGLTFTILLILCAFLIALTNLYQAKENLTIQNNLDHLTQLPNRRRITEATENTLLKKPRSIGFAILDLDLFKGINDLYGHPAGDEVLKKAAALLSRKTKEPNIAARLGGEEFCILFREQTKDDTIKMCEAIREAFENEQMKINDIIINITISIGLYYHDNEDDTTFKQIYQYADHAMYEAKKSGRNQLKLYHPPLEQVI